MKKIAIFQYDLGMGGIQKSLINLLNNLEISNYDIDLYLFSKDNFFDKSIPKSVNIIYIDPQNQKFCNFNTALKNSKINITKKYDITIDFSSYSPDCAIGAIKAQSKKKIIWCHNDIELKIKYEWKYKLLWHFMKQKYEYFNTVVAVSEGAKEGFYNVTKFKDIRVIPNFIDTKEIFEKRKETIDFVENKDYYNIISVGRLCHQKNYEQSLNLMKKLKNKKIKLYIIGGGELEHKLKKIIIKNDLTNVIMLGSKKNPFPYMDKMDALLLTSHYEGQGMVLLEAKALGLELLLPTKLERYVEDIKGSDDLLTDILNSKQKKKKDNNLKEYNEKIIKSISDLL